VGRGTANVTWQGRALLGEAVPATRWEHMVGQARITECDGSMTCEWLQEGVARAERLDAEGLFDVLDKFGTEGWEAVSVAAVQRGKMAFTGTYEVVLKRQVREQVP